MLLEGFFRRIDEPGMDEAFAHSCSSSPLDALSK